MDVLDVDVDDVDVNVIVDVSVTVIVIVIIVVIINAARYMTQAYSRDVKKCPTLMRVMS